MEKLTNKERAKRCRQRIERLKQEMKEVQDFVKNDERFWELPDAVRYALRDNDMHMDDRIAKNEELAERFEYRHANGEE